MTDTPALSHLGRCHKFSNPHAAEGHLHLEPAIVHSNVLCVWTTPYNSPLSTNPPGCSILDFDHDAGQTAGASVGCISLVIAESSFLEKAWYSSEFPIQMYVQTPGPQHYTDGFNPDPRQDPNAQNVQPLEDEITKSISQIFPARNQRTPWEVHMYMTI